MAAPARIYKNVSGAHRAGRKLCRANNWYGYQIYTLDQIYLVTNDNRHTFERWLAANEIPIRDGECSTHYVCLHI